MILLESYHNEIRDFLKSLTIVNQWFAEDSATAVGTTFSNTEIIPAANPYYIHVCGRYAQGDEIITITSADTGEEIEFNLTNLQSHPKTQAFYSLPSKGFDTLCQKYPVHADLIKAIVCPVEVNNNLWDTDSIDYKHFGGVYDDTDEAITVTSVDTGAEIEFTKANLADHPLTRAAYLPPSQNFFNLITEYSSQQDLIVGVLYPYAPIDQIADSAHLSLLAYSNDILPDQELSVMVDAVRELLQCFRVRWSVPEFRYEAYYASVSWCMLWYLLFSRLYTQRIANLRTYSAHPTHIWEYLMSNGLSDYRGTLNDDQASFLYRNLRYILDNAGTQSNLEILTEGLLEQMNIVLRSKWITQNLLTFPTDLARVPEILSHTVGSTDTRMNDFDRGYEGMDNFFSREVDSSLEPEQNDDEIERQRKILLKSQSTDLPTKLIELERTNIDDRQAFQFMEWTLHTSIVLQELELLNYSTTFTFPELGERLELSAGETLAIIQYIIMNDDTAGLLIPTTFNVRATWKNSGDITVPTTCHLPASGTMTIANIVDVDAILADVDQEDEEVTSASDLVSVADGQYRTLMWHNDMVNICASAKLYAAMQKIREATLDIRTVTLSGDNELVPGYTTYDNWFGVNGTLYDVVTYYMQSPELQRTMLSIFVSDGYPVDESQYSGGAKLAEEQYTAMKALFVQLCSYNVAFIDTDLTEFIYPKLKPVLLEMHGNTDDGTWYVDPGTPKLSTVTDRDYVGDTTSGSPDISFADTSRLSWIPVGTVLVGTGIPSGSAVLSVDPAAGTVTIDNDATATGTDIAITANIITQTGDFTMQSATNSIEMHGDDSMTVELLGLFAISAADTEIGLPLAEDGIYNVSIDWGDGTVTEGTNSADPYNTDWLFHTYEEAGLYVVTIEGTSSNWLMSAVSQDMADYLVPMQDIYNIGFDDPAYQYFGYNYLTVDTGDSNAISLTTMDHMFYNMWL